MQLKEYFFKIRFLYLFLPVKFLMKLAKKKVIFPFYHFVDDGNFNFVNHLYKPKTKELFLEDLQFFKKHFTSLPIKDLRSKKKTANNYGFFLSFDDGLSNFYNVVAPILLREKIFAINFLNSNFIDNKGLFYRYKVNILISKILKNDFNKNIKINICSLLKLDVFNHEEVINYLKNTSIKETKLLDELFEILGFSFKDYLKNEKPYLAKNQILELKEQGFYFGAHSKNHPRYSQIALKDQIKETIESVNEVNKQFNLENNYFAFPFSDDGVSKEFFTRIESKKITTFGSSGLKDEDIKTNYQRIPMEFNSVYSAETIIKGELVYYILKRVLGKHKTKRN
jgi:peptidoglycan/xylan/chitin deacetylase (PgdA/CDA1 family)